MKTVSIVIPALNEEKGVAIVLRELPIKSLRQAGFHTEIIVVDNGSTDKTKKIALRCGAKVVDQPVRGYGNAYKLGFVCARGDIIITGDADASYPMFGIKKMVKKLIDEDLDFINTNRLKMINPKYMHRSHIFGNRFLTFLTRLLFQSPFQDSQSGMWIFRRKILDRVKVHSGGMSFSQELKMEVAFKGFKCAEIPIQYRKRIGKAKLRPIKDAIGNTIHLFMKRWKISK